MTQFERLIKDYLKSNATIITKEIIYRACIVVSRKKHKFYSTDIKKLLDEEAVMSLIFIRQSPPNNCHTKPEEISLQNISISLKSLAIKYGALAMYNPKTRSGAKTYYSIIKR
jgi:predicted RNA methylase